MPNVSLLEYANQADPDIAGIVQIITNNSIFMRRLRFIGVPEFSYAYSRQQTTGGIAFRGLNESFTADVGVVNPQVELLKIFGGTVKTDRQLGRGPKGNAVRANNVAQKVKRASLTFDLKVLKGNSQTDPKEFDGLNRRLTGRQAFNAATNGAVLSLDLLDDALDRTVGTDDQKIIVCNKAIRRQMNKLVIDAAGGAAVADVKTGITNYKGAAVEVVDEDGDNSAVLDFDETVGNSAVTTSLYVVNPSGDVDQENMRGLMRDIDGKMIEMVPYGERSGFIEDLVEAVAGIALHHPRCATRLKGLLAA